MVSCNFVSALVNSSWGYSWEDGLCAIDSATKLVRALAIDRRKYGCDTGGCGSDRFSIPAQQLGSLCGELENENGEVRKARRLKIPIRQEGYLGECIRKYRVLPFDLYKVETALESSKGGTTTVKVKGRSVVHESSGLQETCHILEDGKSIYNTTLNISYLTRGVNRNDEKFTCSSVAGRHEYAFNVHTGLLCWNLKLMSEMPLDKVSKEDVHKGFEALTDIQNLLSNTDNRELALRESLIVAASNRFFTLIPSIHPHIIGDEDDLMVKVKMQNRL
ncbi:poly [ADP-ribose] polymerase 1-like [Oryza brachyantha]|uniref:poly [ADP-ribose] polymerase 1-like n=1 Tax=Oryza brachyantha TaxID=4533 RepID=UPI001ADB768F|nr:poly [ADP-ribose] polymerase 1-like [Oryza brachyantha]